MENIAESADRNLLIEAVIEAEDGGGNAERLFPPSAAESLPRNPEFFVNLYVSFHLSLILIESNQRTKPRRGETGSKVCSV